MDLFRKTMKPVEQVLKDAGVKKEDINDVCAISLLTLISPNSSADRPRRWFHSYPQGPTAHQGILRRQGAIQIDQPR